jgi:hypothetical protein
MVYMINLCWSWKHQCNGWLSKQIGSFTYCRDINASIAENNIEKLTKMFIVIDKLFSLPKEQINWHFINNSRSWDYKSH